MKTITDQQLLYKLRTEDGEAFSLLYQSYFGAIAAYVKKNNGNVHDAEDIFQEAMVALLYKVRQPDFKLTSSLNTYLYAIAKNLWLKRLRDSKAFLKEREQMTVLLQEEAGNLTSESNPEKPGEDQLHVWLQKITRHCQQILKAIFFYNEPMASLMEKMGWKNRHTANNQKYKCLQQMKSVSSKKIKTG